jgi:hypothetical protein
MSRFSNAGETVSSARAWTDDVGRLVSDARMAGYVRALSDPRVIADLRATADALRSIADRTDPRSERRRAAKVALGLGVMGAGAYVAVAKLRGIR